MKISQQEFDTLLRRVRENDPTLITIDLNSKEIGDIGAQSLAKALEKNQTVHKIDLRSNRIGDIGAQSLAKALETNQTVHTINLHSNRIGDIGAQSLAKALETNQTVHTINLHSNQIGDIGAQSLAKALETNQTVHTIDLSSNQIGDSGAQSLAKALETNQTVHKINLYFNQIGDSGAQSLAKALETNQTVHAINLVFNQIGKTLANKIDSLKKRNRDLKESAEAFKNRGDIFMHKGEYDKAIADYEDASKFAKDPTLQQLLTKSIADISTMKESMSLAKTNMRYALYDDALEEYQKVLTLFPDHVEAVTGTVSILTDSGDLAKLEQAANLINQTNITAKLDRQEDKAFYLDVIKRIVMPMQQQDPTTAQGLRLTQTALGLCHTAYANLGDEASKEVYLEFLEHSAARLQHEDPTTKEGLAHHHKALQLCKTAYDIFPEDRSETVYVRCVENITATLQRQNMETKEGLAHHQGALKLYETALGVFPDNPNLLGGKNALVDQLQARAQQLTREGLGLLNEQSLPDAKNAFSTSLDIWKSISHHREEECKTTVALVHRKLKDLNEAVAMKQGDFTTHLLQNAMQRAQKIPSGNGKFPPISDNVLYVVNEAVKNNWPAMERISEKIANNDTVVATIASCIKQEKEKGKRTGEVVFKKSAHITGETFNQLLAECCGTIHAQQSRDANALKKQDPVEESTRTEAKKASHLQSVAAASAPPLPVAEIVPPSAPSIPVAMAQVVDDPTQHFPIAPSNLPEAPTHGFAANTTNLVQQTRRQAESEGQGIA